MEPVSSRWERLAKVVAFDREQGPGVRDQDTETDGVQNTATTREVEENAEAVDDDRARRCHRQRR